MAQLDNCQPCNVTVDTSLKYFNNERYVIFMLQLFQEVALPKLSQTSLYIKFDQTSKLTDNVIAEIKNSQETIVNADQIPEILSLIKLNGDAIAKKAVDAFRSGAIIVIHNKATSKIPPTLPFIIMGYKGKPTAFIFADKVVNNIAATNEYANFMTILEAAYLALKLYTNPDTFLMNSQLMLTLCNIYTLMVSTPLEQRLYMKGENLSKAYIYIIAHFYKMIKGNDISSDTIPYKRILSDKIDPNVVSQIVEEVKNNEDMSFIGLVKMIIKINPIRYKDLDSLYMSYFTSSCGVSLIFALENISYLFTLVTASTYKSGITSYSLNKLVAMPCKKAIMQLTSVV